MISLKEYLERDVIRGTWTETETDITVTINGKTDTISTVDRDGSPRHDIKTGTGDMIRIRAQMETLLRKMGVDVEAPGKRGKYKLQVLWPERYGPQYRGRKIGEFKLVPKTQ